MNLNTLFPSVSFTEDEISTLAYMFSDPLVVRYLKSLGVEDSKDLLGLGVLDLPAESTVRRHSFSAGKLAVITTLLSISQTK